MELKTKCTNCKGKLYQGKFWIYGFNARKYCSEVCMLSKELDRAEKNLKTYANAPQLKEDWQKQVDKLSRQLSDCIPF